MVSSSSKYSLDDFKRQLEKFARPGLMQKLIGLIPGMGQVSEMLSSPDTAGDTKRLVGIINSMTPQERRNPKSIDQSRRQRIAKGAGVRSKEVNQLVKQYEILKPMIDDMAGKSVRERIEWFKEMRRLDDTGPNESLL